MPDQNLGTVSTSLFQFTSTILVIVPTPAVFLLLQRFIYNGLTQGATK
ncbi:hypothetical protein HII36_14915 [Nonomuraea sp. NN258]|nr:hypothetical protein [Nonomuraea antri]NRQ33124.1 hypothetical protein [Nonomuraea antri]